MVRYAQTSDRVAESHPGQVGLLRCENVELSHTIPLNGVVRYEIDTMNLWIVIFCFKGCLTFLTMTVQMHVFVYYNYRPF